MMAFCLVFHLCEEKTFNFQNKKRQNFGKDVTFSMA